jgi:hypothetical protein
MVCTMVCTFLMRDGEGFTFPLGVKFSAEISPFFGLGSRGQYPDVLLE